MRRIDFRKILSTLRRNLKITTHSCLQFESDDVSLMTRSVHFAADRVLWCHKHARDFDHREAVKFHTFYERFAFGFRAIGYLTSRFASINSQSDLSQNKSR